MRRGDYFGDSRDFRITSEADLLLPGGATLLSSQDSSDGLKEPSPSFFGIHPEACSGIVLENKYRLDQELGRGGMGTVFRAIDESLGRVVAIKFLLPVHQSDDQSVERFRREAKAMASIRHENVIQIYSFGSEGQTDFFVMEYIEGETCEQMIMNRCSRGGFIPLGEVVRILDQACAGLTSIHNAGVVHRDIKPSNFMLETENNRVVIMDFGLGHRRQQHDESGTTLITGGTPGYMAPEIVSGRSLAMWEEVLSDIYSFGVAAHELLTGQPLFEAENTVELLQCHLNKIPEPPSAFRSDVPAGIDDIVMQCLDKDPGNRFQWCDELRGALQPYLYETGSAINPLVTSPPPKASESPKPHIDMTPSEIATGPRIVVSGEDNEIRALVYTAAQRAIPNGNFRAARSALSALRMVRDVPPVVLVASMSDPDLNGLELAGTMLGDERLASIYLILIADNMSDYDEQLLKGMGVFQILRKPLDGYEVERVFREAYSRWKRREARKLR